MIQVQCPGCMSQVFLDCTCPPGHAANVGAHHPECSHASIDAQLNCRCCPQDHDHAAAANACPGGHGSCPDAGRDCRTWRGIIADALNPAVGPESHPAFEGSEIPDCPGGHCHKDIPDCTVCRPLIITVMPGTDISLTANRGGVS